MLPDDNLWNRIEQFELDEPDAGFPFSARLARETGWTYSHTQRVIQEYKRFVYLACVAGHPVSPSHDVDEVWHLHLTYTQSYWEKFCPEVLQCPLHHSPTKGGRQEGAKFEDWYQRTLESYERYFGPSPEDIWPRPGTQAKPKPEIKVDPTQNWVIPKPPWWPLKFQKPVRPLSQWLMPFVVLLVAVAGGCGSGGGASLGPWDLDGPMFLTLYWGLCAVAIAVSLWWRAQNCLPDDESYPAQYLDAPTLARLASPKPERVSQAALAFLWDHGLIKALRPGILTVPVGASRPREAVAAAIWDAVKEGRASQVALLQIANDHAERIDTTLRNHGLLLSPESNFLANIMPQIVHGVLLVFGVGKIAIGLGRSKPVEFLTLMCIALLAWMLIFEFGMKKRLTRRGERYLQHFTTRVYYAPPEEDPLFTGMALAVALDGAGGLPYQVQPLFQPPRNLKSVYNGSGSGGSGCSGTSGCGSDSSSSSGSDGGGSSSSCGSSGCGGCGGGGGD